MPTNRIVTIEDVEKTLSRYGIRTRTLFRKKSRKLSSVLNDMAKKWYAIAEEDKYIIQAYFAGNIYIDAMDSYYNTKRDCCNGCYCSDDNDDNCNNCDHE